MRKELVRGVKSIKIIGKGEKRENIAQAKIVKKTTKQSRTVKINLFYSGKSKMRK